jgi:hypothetical protein
MEALNQSKMELTATKWTKHTTWNLQ